MALLCYISRQIKLGGHQMQQFFTILGSNFLILFFILHTNSKTHQLNDNKFCFIFSTVLQVSVDEVAHQIAIRCRQKLSNLNLRPPTDRYLATNKIGDVPLDEPPLEVVLRVGLLLIGFLIYLELNTRLARLYTKVNR